MLTFLKILPQCLESNLFTATPECINTVEDTISKQFDQFQGLWLSELDHKVMGEIRGHSMHWDPGVFNQAPTEFLSTKDGCIEMQLLGSLYTATFEDGLKPRLRWNDGEVWVRVDLKTAALCSVARPCAWDDDDVVKNEISLSIDMEIPHKNHHPLPHEDSFELMIDPNPGIIHIPRKESDFREQLRLPHMDQWPCPPTCTPDASFEERRALLWHMYQEFALELYTGANVKQLVSNSEYVDTILRVSEDMQTLKVDQNSGNIIEFPLRNVSRLYRMIKHGDRWRGASNPALRAVIRGDAEEVVVVQFLRRKIAFRLPSVDETQRFMMYFGLVARRGKEKYISDREDAKFNGVQCGPDNEFHCGTREIVCGAG